MGATAAPWTLPYPDPPDPADVPVDMKELADRLQIHLAAMDARVAAVEASAGSFVLLGDVRLAAAAPMIDFPNIPQTYSQLRVLLAVRGDNAGNTNLYLQVNGVSGAGYDWQRVSGAAAVAGAGEGINAGGIVIGSLPAAAANANMFSHAEVVIPDYTGGSHQFNVFSTNFRKISVQSGDMLAGVYGGGWRSVAPVTRISILGQAGNLIAGSRATLYGMRGSA